MKTLIALLALAACGAAPTTSPVDGTTTNPPVTGATLVKATTCNIPGTDGNGSPYMIEYVLSEFSNNTEQTSCIVSDGILQNVTCPVEKPYFVSYYLASRVYHGAIYTVVFVPANRTVAPTDPGCSIKNF